MYTFPDIKHKFDGTAAPTASDDRSAGYEAGRSRWVDVLTGKEYRCIDANRICRIYLNGAKVATTGVLTTAKNLIPFFSIQARGAAAKVAHLRWIAASMEMAA